MLHPRRLLVAAMLTTTLGCSSDDSATKAEPDAQTPCDAEPVIRTTDSGEEFVRTPDACFEGLPAWPYEPQYVEIEGLRQAYIDEGPSDGEVVLLLHGQPSWSYLYRKVIPGLTEAGYRVIAMDHLGMGRSDKPVDIASYSYVRHADRLAAFLEALDLRGITVFVQDWGSLIGLRVVGQDPDRFARVAIGNGDLPVIPADTPAPFVIDDPDEVLDLDNPYAGIPDQQRPFFDGCDLDLAEIMASMGTDASFETWATYSMKARDFRPGEIVENLTWYPVPDDEEEAYNAPFPSRIYMAGPRTFPSLVTGMAGLNAEEWQTLSAFPRPLLTIWGSNDPGNLGQCATQDKYVCDVPGAQGQAHVRLPESAHFLQDDQGEEIARRLVAFLQQTDDYDPSYEGACDSEAGPDGLGETCSSDDDCAGQAADLCLSSGTAPGFCTIEGCVPDDCGGAFVCCGDCSEEAASFLPFEDSACFPDAAASQLEDAAGCSCE